MNGEQGFIDLRLNQQEGQVNESFWPSFTDIMTVVVMIFLIAMVVLLMRNMELVRELRATMEAERVASELARATYAERDTLSSQLHAAQDRISALQLRLMRLEERNLAQEATITNQLTQLADVTSERDQATRQTAQLSMVRDRLETELEAAQVRLQRTLQTLSNLEANVAGLEQNLENLQSRFVDSQAQVTALNRTLVEQQQQMAVTRDAQQDVERKYLVLTGEYDDLKTKYEKLVKPARSSSGRRLVEVRYWKQGDTYRIAYRDGDTGPFAEVSRAELERALAQLRDASSNGLYVKVIFPENSGLSYNEAWGFTTDLHRDYDYYFQDSPADETTPREPQR